MQKVRLAFAIGILSMLIYPSVGMSDGLTSERRQWLADFAQLKGMIADIYPNLDVALEVQKLDLPKLSRQTQMQLSQATSREQAISILKQFVAQFKDGHLALKSPDPLDSQVSDSSTLDKEMSGQVACRKLGAKPKNFHFGFLPNKEMGFGELHVQGLAFPYTTLRLNGKKVGFIKIPSFGGDQYPEVCAQEWEHFRTSLKGVCDQDCEENFLYIVLPNRLLIELGLAIEALKQEKIAAMVIDVANNGGGNDWVAAAMRMFTAKPILCGQFGFVRHAHWTKKLQKEVEDLKMKLAASTSQAEKATLNQELAQADTDLIESKKKCDRSRVWTDPTYRPTTCDQVAKRPVITCEAKPEFQFKRGIYDGPLFVLFNSSTASAAEDLVGRLKESGAATLIGSKTLGAGCGFTDHGIDLKLKHLGLIVKISDCARYMRTGVNEVVGISPDIELPDIPSGSLELTSRLKELLEKALH